MRLLKNFADMLHTVAYDQQYGDLFCIVPERWDVSDYFKLVRKNSNVLVQASSVASLENALPVGFANA